MLLAQDWRHITHVSKVMRTVKTVLKDIVWGLDESWAMAVFFAIIAVIGRLIVGPKFARGLRLLDILIDYALLGIIAGLLMGVFRPLTGTVRGAAIVGAIWGIFLMAMIRINAVGLGNWHPKDIIWLSMGIFIGALFGSGQRRVADRVREREN